MTESNLNHFADVIHQIASTSTIVRENDPTIVNAFDKYIIHIPNLCTDESKDFRKYINNQSKAQSSDTSQHHEGCPSTGGFKHLIKTNGSLPRNMAHSHSMSMHGTCPQNPNSLDTCTEKQCTESLSQLGDNDIESDVAIHVNVNGLANTTEESINTREETLIVDHECKLSSSQLNAHNDNTATGNGDKKVKSLNHTTVNNSLDHTTVNTELDHTRVNEQCLYTKLGWLTNVTFENDPRLSRKTKIARQKQAMLSTLLKSRRTLEKHTDDTDCFIEVFVTRPEKDAGPKRIRLRVKNEDISSGTAMGFLAKLEVSVTVQKVPRRLGNENRKRKPHYYSCSNLVKDDKRRRRCVQKPGKLIYWLPPVK